MKMTPHCLVIGNPALPRLSQSLVDLLVTCTGLSHPAEKCFAEKSLRCASWNPAKIAPRRMLENLRALRELIRNLQR